MTLNEVLGPVVKDAAEQQPPENGAGKEQDCRLKIKIVMANNKKWLNLFAENKFLALKNEMMGIVRNAFPTSFKPNGAILER